MKFKVGDRVQFKTWEEMEKEYRIDPDGDITPRFTTVSFTQAMRFLCGAFATVEEIVEDGTVFLKDFSVENGYAWPWHFLEYMLKPAKQKYELHIMSDGKITTAVRKENGEVVARSQARLSPKDAFSFEEGARIAFDRVFNAQTEKEQEELSFELFNNFSEPFGKVGKPTKYKDKNGRPLFVGDVVHVKEAVSHRMFVVSHKGADFIFGLLLANYNEKTGNFEDAEVTLAKPFNEVEEGETYFLITKRRTHE